MPICVEDPTTKFGTAAVIWDFLIITKLIGFNENNKRFCHSPDYKNKWMFPVGDELSIRRMFEFFDDIMSILDGKFASFSEAYLQAMEIRKVIPQITPVGGDLHLRFHILDAILRQFGGGFLQVLQWKLGWKKLI